MFSPLLQTARGILNTLIRVVHFSKYYKYPICSFFLVYYTATAPTIFKNLFYGIHSIKKVHENYWYCSSIVCQEKRRDWILRIFTFNDKNRLYLPIISKLQFFEGESDQGVTQLVIKPFGISQTSRIVGLRLKKMPRFSKPPFIFHLFF